MERDAPHLVHVFETLGSMVADSRASTDTKRLTHGITITGQPLLGKGEYDLTLIYKAVY